MSTPTKVVITIVAGEIKTEVFDAEGQIFAQRKLKKAEPRYWKGTEKASIFSDPVAEFSEDLMDAIDEEDHIGTANGLEPPE